MESPKFSGLARILSRLLGLALVAAVLLNSINVIGRYVFNHPLTGVDELQTYLMVAMAFVGGLVAHINGRHLRMDVLKAQFPPQVRRWIDAGEAFLTVAICGLLAWTSTSHTFVLFRIGSTSQNAHVPIWLPHSVLALSFILMTLVALAALPARVWGIAGGGPAADPERVS